MSDIESLLEDAVAAIGRGDVVGVPTDTVYGIGTAPAHAGRLFALKGRPPDKPIGVLVADVAQALEAVELPTAVEALVRQFWPGPLTVVAHARIPLHVGVGDLERGTLGVRVPDHPLARALLARTGPLAVTSANPSGRPPALEAGEARAAFGEGVAVYLPGASPGGTASTVVDVTGERLVVLRPGPVGEDTLEAFLER